MRHESFKPLLLVSITLVLIGTTDTRAKTVDQQIDNIQRSMERSPKEGVPTAVKAYNTLFTQISNNDLRELAKSGPMNIAIHARWHLRRFESYAKFDPRSPLNFLRYFKDADITVPLDWAPEFDAAFIGNDIHEVDRAWEYYYKHGSKRAIPDDGLEHYGVYYMLGNHFISWMKSSFGFYLEHETKVSIKDGRLRVSQGKRTISCPANIVPPKKKHFFGTRHCVAALGDKRSFLLFFGNEAESYPIYCIENETGNVLWKSTVWSVYPLGVPYFSSGPPLEHNVYLSASEEMVVIFGSGMHLYVEAFDIASGKPAARFSTNLWNGDKPYVKYRMSFGP